MFNPLWTAYAVLLVQDNMLTDMFPPIGPTFWLE